MRDFCQFYNLDTGDVMTRLRHDKADLGEVLGYASDGLHCKKKPIYAFEAIFAAVSAFHPHIGFVRRARLFLTMRWPVPAARG